METGRATAPNEPAHAEDPAVWGGPSPRALALGGFACLFAAGLLLWAKYGSAIFVDGAAALWACL